MTALEEIQQAIDTLERLKKASTPGEWRPVVTRGEHWHIHAKDAEEAVAWIVIEDGSNEAVREPNARLIVTLHRTIDAQLAILRREHEFALKFGWPAQPFPERLDVLNLARAINGSAS